MGPKKDGERGGRGGSWRGRGRGGGGRGRSKKIDVTATPVAERQRLFSECSEDHCAVCLSLMNIFSVGLCNHHVCSECSTRMRVLCGQNECPICRQDMPKVFHTESRVQYADVADKIYPMDKRYRICFENDKVQEAYELRLQHGCPLCQEREPFRNFKQLQQHIKRDHDMYYCELCVDNLTIFTHERKLYNRDDLATHKQTGDTDNSSHKGHPLCKFCDVRFVDDDELFRHLRRDHYFCHFCDADGLQHYYPNYDSLKKHFRNEHYLCEEGSCMHEQFTSAFRSEIDIKAHRAERHMVGLSKAAVKQNRTVEVDVTFTRPGSFNQVGRRRGREPSPPPSNDIYPSDQTDGNSGETKVPDMASDFPSLDGASGGNSKNNSTASSNNLANRVAITSGRNVSQATWSSGKLTPNMEQDFPSLPGAQAALPSGVPSYGPPAKGQKAVKVTSRRPEADFPSLPSTSMANYRPAPVYRNMTGYQPAWTKPNDSDNIQQQPQVASNSNSSCDSKMVTLTKKAVAPAPDLDFPSLEQPSKPVEPSSNKKKANKKKNNNNNKFGSLVGDDLQLPPGANFVVDNGSSLKGSANLKAAADLIFKEKPLNKKKAEQKKATPVQQETKENIPIQAKSSDNSDWQRVAAAPKAVVVKEKQAVVEEEDFPTLGPSVKKMSAHFVQPVHLEQQQQQSNHKKAAPPGFSAVKKSSRPPPGFSQASWNYHEPRDFKERNSKLVSTVAKAMGGGKSLEFGQFKEAASQFRAGQMSGCEYHAICLKLSGGQGNLETFLPELLSLLPDISKQKELLKVHREKFANTSMSSLIMCDVCGQVVTQPDLKDHKSCHKLDADFPLLA